MKKKYEKMKYLKVNIPCGGGPHGSLWKEFVNYIERTKKEFIKNFDKTMEVEKIKNKDKEIIFTVKNNLTNKLKRIDKEWRLCGQICKIGLRGRKYPPSKYENEFWDRFPELLFDDPEDQHNQLIGILRDTVQKYLENRNI